MANGEEKGKWTALYRKALQEHDPDKLPARVAQAQCAIRRRALELWYAGAPDTTERRQLDTASRLLGLLSSIEGVK